METAFTNFTCDADVSVGRRGDAGVIFRAGKPDIGADVQNTHEMAKSPVKSRTTSHNSPLFFTTRKHFH